MNMIEVQALHVIYIKHPQYSKVLPFISLKESRDSVSDDGTGERTGGSGNTGCSNLFGVVSLATSVCPGLTGLLAIPFTLSAQLLPTGGELQHQKETG